MADLMMDPATFDPEDHVRRILGLANDYLSGDAMRLGITTFSITTLRTIENKMQRSALLC
jgi:hypothetical protein